MTLLMVLLLCVTCWCIYWAGWPTAAWWTAGAVVWLLAMTWLWNDLGCSSSTPC